jgi:hypothetical protein
MSHISIIEPREILSAGSASPADLRFDVKKLAGRSIRWAIGADSLDDALARSDPGDLIIECANCGVADDWFHVALIANGQPGIPNFQSWRPNAPNPDWVLLSALYECWPNPRDAFDGSSIYWRATEVPALRTALEAVLGHGLFRQDGRLKKEALPRVRRWLDKNVGRPLAGLVLVRDLQGWCSVQRRPRLATVSR